MFQNEGDVTVLGGTLTQVVQGLNGRQILSQSSYVVQGAIHDSGVRYPPSECHPGTREDILKVALGWVAKPPLRRKSQVFWLSGPAGVGKTAIAQTLCQRLKELGLLGGDFFLSRSVAGHNNLHTLFPTLAYQLARTDPEFGLVLDTVIKTDEAILTKNMELQLEQLIINPLKQMNNPLKTPLILIIDGLDEAGGESDQVSLLQLLGLNLLKHRLPLKIVITSRPEPWIKRAFSDKSLSGIPNPFLSSSLCHFLNQTPQIDDDIRTVLYSGFTKIRETHDRMKGSSDDWPSSKVIEDIIDRASGQFIYISTILKYVEDPNGNPTERLQRIIEILPKGRKGNYPSTDSPFLALDNLYKHILWSALDTNRTLAVLGVVIAGFLTPNLTSLKWSFLGDRKRTISFSLNQIGQILGFQPGDSVSALRQMQSLVDISSNEEDDVKFYHKSFQDFLLDPNRAEDYFIEMNHVYSKVMTWAFGLLRESGQPESEPKRHQDLALIGQQCLSWWLRAAASDEDRLLREIRTIDSVVFYRNYAGNIARKVSWFPSKTPTNDGFVSSANAMDHHKDGNIAESILGEIKRPWALDFPLERFNAVQTVFEKHISRAVRVSKSESDLYGGQPVGIGLLTDGALRGG